MFVFSPMLVGRSWLQVPRRRPAAGRKGRRGAQGMAEGWLWPAASLRRMCGGGWKVRLKGAPQCSPSTELRVTAAGPPDSHSYNWEDSPAPSRGCWRAVGEMDGWKRPSARHRFIIIISSACYIPMLLLLIKRAKSLAHRARRTNTYAHIARAGDGALPWCPQCTAAAGKFSRAPYDLSF